MTPREARRCATYRCPGYATVGELCDRCAWVKVEQERVVATIAAMAAGATGQAGEGAG